jgi:ABC-2 type transport system ATP-binding protein
VRMLSALIAPSRGEARVAGFPLSGDGREIRRRVGLLTETPGLYDKLSALENLSFFAGLYDIGPKQARAQAERYLKLLGLLERKNDPVGGFSKGMRQKLAIVRALLHDPEIIFLDEPTSGLDPEATRTVRDFIQSLKAEGRTIFLTTHNLPEADELCDLIGVFRRKLLRLGSPQELRADLFGRGARVRLRGGALAWEARARALPFAREVSAKGDELSISLADPEAEIPPLVRALCEAGAEIQAVAPVRPSLEEIYLRLIGETPGPEKGGS